MAVIQTEPFLSDLYIGKQGQIRTPVEFQDTLVRNRKTAESHIPETTVFSGIYIEVLVIATEIRF